MFIQKFISQTELNTVALSACGVLVYVHGTTTMSIHTRITSIRESCSQISYHLQLAELNRELFRLISSGVWNSVTVHIVSSCNILLMQLQDGIGDQNRR
jgi:hypothetical protein